MLRRIGVLTSLAVTAAMFAGVSSAQAQYEQAACVFTGLSGALVDPIPPPPAGLGQVGSYDFTGRANCAATLTGGGQITPDADGENTTITSAGTYDNIACGTGWAYDLGGDGSTVVDPDAGAPISNIGYEIFFGGGNGNLVIGEGNANAPSANGAALGGGYTGDGVVHITPQNRQPPNNVGCATAPTAQFEVAGSFAADAK